MMSRLRPRILPATILVMVALLLVKGTYLVQAGGATSLVAASSWTVMPTAQAAGGKAAPAPAAHGAAPAPVPAAATPVIELPPAEPPVSDAERTILLDLRARRGVIETREQAMAAREATQAAAERRLNERVTQLTALQARLEQLDQVRKDRDDANWRGLVKTYETMRPRDAATIMNDLETPVLLEVLDRMKEAKAALVLGAMQPDRARAATAGLAQLRTRGVTPPSLGPQP